MIDHVLALLRQETKELRYRVYLTDALRVIGENTAKYVQGQYIATRWADTLREKKEEEQSGDEIAADVIRRAGLSLGGEIDVG